MLLELPEGYNTLTGDDSKSAFTAFKDQIQAIDGFELAKFGIGVAMHMRNPDGSRGQLLDVTFNHTNGEGTNTGSATMLQNVFNHLGGTKTVYATPGKLRKALKSFGPQYLGEPKEKHATIADIQWAMDEAFGMSDAFGVMRLAADPGYDRVYSVVVGFIGDLADAPYGYDVVTESSSVPDLTRADMWLRLHLLSHCEVRPNQINLVGIFDIMSILTWTNVGPMLPKYFEANRLALRRSGVAVVGGTDRFPRYVDYVEAGTRGVRIADPNRVRLGAHLAPGTTIMHEGFVNYNAGTLGPSMVEGRISQGVVVGEGTDIGGGVSILGTLSGGNLLIISIGEYCLLEAECGLGIPIGDRVRIEAGLFLKSTTVVRVDLYDKGWDGNVVIEKLRKQNPLAPAGEGPLPYNGTLITKAENFSGISDAIARRHSQFGYVQLIPRGDTSWGKLTAKLHANA